MTKSKQEWEDRLKDFTLFRNMTPVQQRFIVTFIKNRISQGVTEERQRVVEMIKQKGEVMKGDLYLISLFDIQDKQNFPSDKETIC